MKQLLEKPATHAAWAPFFSERGFFVRFVQVGEGLFNVDSTGNTIVETVQYATVNGYDSGYFCLIPMGQQPPAEPPSAIIDAARYEAEQRRSSRAA